MRRDAVAAVDDIEHLNLESCRLRRPVKVGATATVCNVMCTPIPRTLYITRYLFKKQ